MRADRRKFLFSLAAMATAPPRFLLAGGVPPLQGTVKGLPEDQLTLLGDVCEQIVPADDFPGARELGVATFIGRVLREAHPEWVAVYQAGLTATDLSSERLFQASFVKLNFDQQLQLLQRMERGDLPADLWPSPPAGDFFSMVRSHTMQGFYSHPRWGGNRDKLAWKMIGFDDWWV